MKEVRPTHNVFPAPKSIGYQSRILIRLRVIKRCKISDNPGSDIYHRFLTPLAERRIQLARHKKTQGELLALVVDEKTGKVSKPAGGSKDCIDAVVGLVETLHIARTFLHSQQNWNIPHIPEMKWMDDASYMITGGTPMYLTHQV